MPVQITEFRELLIADFLKVGSVQERKGGGGGVERVKREMGESWDG